MRREDVAALSVYSDSSCAGDFKYSSTVGRHHIASVDSTGMLNGGFACLHSLSSI